MNSGQCDSNGDCVGVFGGSFDPPHLGHLMMARSVLEHHPDMRLLVVPCFIHPFAKSMESFEHRVEMCRLMTEELARTEVSGIESQTDSGGRTLNTLKELKKRNSSWNLRLVIGQDVYAQRDLWYRFDEIERIAPPLVVGRRNAPEVEVELLDEIPDISSTEVRDRLMRGESADELLLESVAMYIRTHGLYSTPN